MRAMALGHFVPARSEDSGSLVHHPEEQGALFRPFEQTRYSGARFPEPAEGWPESEAEKMGGVQEGGNAAGELPPLGGREVRMEGPRPARMPVYGSRFRGRDPSPYAP